MIFKADDEKEEGDKENDFDLIKNDFKDTKSLLNYNLFDNGNTLFIEKNKEENKEDEDVDFWRNGSGSTLFSSKKKINYEEFPLESNKSKSFFYDQNDELNLPSSLLDIEDEEDLDNEENPLEAQLKAQKENPENLMMLTNVISLAKEQSSCRYLQKKIEENPELGCSYFYPTIISHLNDLIIHPFGNYLIQKIFKYISEAQRTEILHIIEPNLLIISVNFYGTRVIQKFIETIQTETLMTQLLKVVKLPFISLLNDINGSHIIMKLLSLKEPYIMNSLYESLNSNLLEISMNKHGCCAIQKIIENNGSLSKNIIENIIKNCIALITHQYGNYTVQYVLQLKNQMYSMQIITQIIPNLSFLAKQKYSSTVIEKCFNLCDDMTKRAIYLALFNRQIFKELLLDKFGNYVIQKALDCSDEITKQYFLSMIAPLLPELKRLNFGKQLCNKLCMKYPILMGISPSIMNFQMNQENIYK